jgi:flavin-dependent thymidylate synthase
MNVELLAATPDALDLLLFTKNTRLTMSRDAMETVKGWSDEKKAEELRYMRNTIQSSWEFVDYTFAITGVTRAFTHQLVRHRVGTSFAQQAQRVVNMEGFDYLVTGAKMTGRPDENFSVNSRAEMHLDDSTAFATYADTMTAISDAYGDLIAKGVKPQDARGVLPTNVLTNIIFKANLRTLHDMALKRLCVKAQGEFQDVFRLLVDQVVAEHPWAADFLRVQCAWNGTCLFPTLPVDECHVKPYVYDAANAVSYGESMGRRRHEDAPLFTTEQIYQLHRAGRSEPQPVVRA